MGELSDFAQQHAREEQNRRQQEQSDQAASLARLTEGDPISRARAEEFVGLMQRYQVPTLTLGRQGPFRGNIRSWMFQGEGIPSLTKGRVREMETFAVGWLAIKSMAVETGYDSYTSYGVFVAENTDTYKCFESGIQIYRNISYVVPSEGSFGDGKPLTPDNHLLSTDDAARRLAQSLIQLGIVQN